MASNENGEGGKAILSQLNFMLNEICLKKKAAGDDSENEIVLTTYKDKCLSLIDEVKDTSDGFYEENVVIKYLQKFAQLMLDVTYQDECTLVNDEFPIQTSWTTIRNIIENLNRVEKLAAHVLPSTELIKSLGEEIVECLHWRRGALCYMYSHTLNEPTPVTTFPCHYRQCLEEGVIELLDMLSTRSKPSWLRSHTTQQTEADLKEEDIICNDKTTAQLFMDGIFSDTHMLALMYCGQLCYWHTQAIKQETFTLSETDTIGTTDARISRFLAVINGDFSKDTKACQSNAGVQHSEQKDSDLLTHVHSDTELPLTTKVNSSHNVYADIGNMCLMKYVELAKGPLQIGGWNTEQADKNIEFLSKS